MAIAPRIKYSKGPVEDGRGAGWALDCEPEGDPEPEVEPELLPPVLPELDPEFPDPIDPPFACVPEFPEFSPPVEGFPAVIGWSRLRLVLARTRDALMSNPHEAMGATTTLGTLHGPEGILVEVEVLHWGDSMSSNPVWMFAVAERRRPLF